MTLGFFQSSKRIDAMEGADTDKSGSNSCRSELHHGGLSRRESTSIVSSSGERFFVLVVVRATREKEVPTVYRLESTVDYLE
jgi:hypothetical protein